MTLQGHPRSLILAPIESAYGTYLLTYGEVVFIVLSTKWSLFRYYSKEPKC